MRYPKNGIFSGEMYRHMNHEEEKKPFFCCSQVALAFELFEVFLCKKSLKQPSGQNNLASQKTVFFLPHDSYVGAFLLKIYFLLCKIKVAQGRGLEGHISLWDYDQNTQSWQVAHILNFMMKKCMQACQVMIVKHSDDVCSVCIKNTHQNHFSAV